MKDVSGSVLVIGGGIAGIQASLDIADQGFKVYLVEKDPSIGGRMAQLDKTFPTNDCSICIEAPKMVEVARHPNIEVLAYSEVKDVKGKIGNFKVKVLRKPRYVDEELCNGCGLCVEEIGCIKACPVGAIKKDPLTGIISIDEELCKQEIEENGCTECVVGCQYDAICIPPGYDHVVTCDLCGGEPKCIEACPVDALELKKFHVKLTVDPEKCTGCRTCELVCSEENDGTFSPNRSRIKIEEKAGIIDSLVCQLCKVDVKCVDSCPVNALEKDEESGAVTVSGLCAASGGCSACVEACEYDAIKIPQGSTEPILCDLCGGEPKCMELCPVDAISMEIFYEGIEIDSEKCTGCRTCELVCSEEKEGVFNPKKSRIQILETGSGDIDAIRCKLCKTCPVYAPSEFDAGMGLRKAVYIPFPQAVPSIATVDRDNCIICGCCDYICKEDATDAVIFSQKPEEIEIRVGSVVVATGYEEYDPSAKEEYGFGLYDNVVTGLQYERLLMASGPTHGHVVRPSDHKDPQKIAWIQCVGSRDENAHKYCSRACCMWATKQAMITKEHDKSIDTTIFHMDLRAYGKNFEEFYVRAQEQSGIKYIKSRPAEVIETPDKKLILRYEDLSTGELKEFDADLLVLSSAIMPNKSNTQLSEALRVGLDENGFFQEKDMISAPLETNRAGVYMGGCISGPKDIPDSIAQSCGAAAKAIIPVHEARGKDIEAFELPPEKEIADDDEPRVGVFVCRCGINIGGVVDVEDVVEYASTIPGVVFSEVDTFTCSDDCQTRIKNAIEEHKLNRVLVAACTPKTHEPLFRATLREIGLNPYLFEFANIREHCSWIHQGEKGLATEKAKDLVRMGVGKAKLLLAEEEGELEVGEDALVIGGGVSGITTSLDLADMGFKVHLVEKENELGGLLSKINKLFPTDVSAENIIRPKIDAVMGHENIKVYTGADILELNGFVGNFNTVISQNGSEEAFKAATVILATGSKEIDPTGYYGYGQLNGVITQLELESMLKEGNLKEPKNVVIITCVGAREDVGRTYCCRIGCGTSIKNAKYIKELYPNANVTVLYYQDLRVFGKREEEYYREVRYNHGVQFINYTKEKKPEVSSDNGKLTVDVYDSFLGEDIKLSADLVVLTVATEGAEDIEKVQKMLKVPLGVGNFLAEAHVKIRPLDFASDGIYLCGSANFPRSVPDAISQASGAASRASIPMGQGKVKSEGIVSIINEEMCVSCGTCEPMCPYSAIRTEDDGRVYVLTALCKGCGTCAAACPTGAVDQRHFQNDQIIAQIKNVFYYEA